MVSSKKKKTYVFSFPNLARLPVHTEGDTWDIIEALNVVKDGEKQILLLDQLTKEYLT